MTDSKNQKVTIDTYEKMVQHYIDRTPSAVEGKFKDYVDNFLSKVFCNAEILEIGSATGRDADYIESKKSLLRYNFLRELTSSHELNFYEGL